MSKMQGGFEVLGVDFARESVSIEIHRSLLNMIGNQLLDTESRRDRKASVIRALGYRAMEAQMVLFGEVAPERFDFQEFELIDDEQVAA